MVGGTAKISDHLGEVQSDIIDVIRSYRKSRISSNSYAFTSSTDFELTLLARSLHSITSPAKPSRLDESNPKTQHHSFSHRLAASRPPRFRIHVQHVGTDAFHDRVAE